MVVCCSTRDELDAVCSAVSNISYICVTPLYSDLAESERALILDKFRHVTMKWKQNTAVQSGQEECEKEEQKSHMIVATDACLPLSASGESPISSSVLINYELPTKKVPLTCFHILVMGSDNPSSMGKVTGSIELDGIVINMVVGGEVVTLKTSRKAAAL
ncbi:hypothetical protein HanIR_Chr09g0429181 [Helianthus annuus]|nr:hypothetical protein HanIR_Chr09g0429181 [Helianthus annuus]